MWSEPLTATAALTDANTLDTHVLAADGATVAHVRCAINRQARSATFGEMTFTDAAGGPIQKVRALRLLVREAFAHAAAHGIQTISTEAPDRLLQFVRDMTGPHGHYERIAENHTRISGALADGRSHLLEKSDANGNLA